MTVYHVWAVETADLSLFRNPEFAINFESFFDLTIDQAAWRYHHAIAIADFNHKRAGRNQRRKIGMVELPEHSKIILIDDIEVKNVGSALRQIGRLDVPIVEVTARYDDLKTRFAHQLPLTPFDATQIQQVLVNLIKNAIQAMTRGGTLTVQTGEGSEAVWVSVADTGGGIPEEQLNRIFEPFYTTKKKGTGLGLMIVQRIVREKLSIF